MSGLHGHHDDGRIARGGRYVDALLTSTMRPRDHGALHLVLDDCGLAFPDGGDLLLHRARRHVVTAGWHADHGVPRVRTPEASRAEQQLWLDVLHRLEGRSR